MPRPTTKAALLAASEADLAALIGAIDALPVEAREAGFAFEDRDRQVRDVVWHLHVDLPTAISRLATTHRQLPPLIEAHDDVELWEQRRYPWTGSTSLGAYLVSCTSSHYAW